MQHADDIPSPVTYSRLNLTLRFLNILTYPRKAKKFKLLLNKFTSLGLLRDIMLTEVGLTNIEDIELYSKGRKLSRDLDSSNLTDLGFKNNQQIIISRKLGKGNVLSDSENAMNRRFIGDLLFGYGGCCDCEHHRHHQHHLNQQQASSPPSIVHTLTLSHGYRLLAKILERIIKERFSECVHREEIARQSEFELYELIEKENQGKVSSYGNRSCI